VKREPRPARGAPRPRHEAWWAAGLLVLHAALALWGAARNSVTFDENFHLPSGVLIARAAEFRVSAVNPPLVKALCGWAALAAGARIPTLQAMGDGEQSRVGEAFMRANADRYQRVFFAARCVVVALSVLLGCVVWRWARRLCGPLAGLVALGFYAFAPEALAHAGVVTLDLATALGFAASVYAFWCFARSGRWNWWLATVVAVGGTFLIRFAAVLLAPTLVTLAVLGTALGRFRPRRRLWLGLALLPVTTLAIVNLGYLGRASLAPLSAWSFRSHPFKTLQSTLPALRVLLPDAYVAGFDRQLVESGSGVTPTFLFDRIRRDAPWYYFPVALLVKWPLGFLVALVARAVMVGRAPPTRRRVADATCVLIPAALYLAVGMFVAHLCIGVRYVLPILPFLCVWCGGLVGRSVRPMAAMAASHRWRAALATALVVLVALETAFVAPWYLSFFNAAAGGPGGGYRIVNDSNVDWGQGLIALRDEMRRRGITRIHLAYHGTVDPAVYGIDYIPYLGGRPGPESEWLAVSSYFYVGLTQRLMIHEGRTPPTRFDFSRAAEMRPVAEPAHCMFLFRLPRAAGS
jgi:dolichyl-phosphate-mannose-protein mannosyltransferase